MSSPEKIVIKKYANRRLYDTKNKCFVNSGELAQMIKDGKEITVLDKVSGEDITASVLTQVIVDEGRSNSNLFSVSSLHQFIRSSGSTYQRLVEDILTTGTKTLLQAGSTVESTLNPKSNREKSKKDETSEELEAIKAKLAELEKKLAKN